MKDISTIEQYEVETETLNLEYTIVCQEQKRIMLLSNTKDLRRMIQISLETIFGWQVCIADLNSESLIMVEAIKPSIILIDTVLPNVKGLKILETFLAHLTIANIPIVLLTERMRLADRQLYSNLGIAGAIVKPFDTIDLAKQIATKLNWDLTL